MHTDPELLALLALGESAGTEEDRSHVSTCPVCAGELAELQGLTSRGRSVSADTMMISPGRQVWDRIRAELGLDRPVESAPVAHWSGAQDVDVTAKALLAPVALTWSRASGTAALSTDEHGRRLLQVALRADLPTSGVRQAWLVHRDDPTQRQTLGILDGTQGLWTVDHALDLDQYTILDISQQGTGETEHSGHTIVRGELTLVS